LLRAVAPGVARGLKLRHDHGPNYMSGDFQGKIKCRASKLRRPSSANLRVMGVAERFIRTLKENLLWLWAFKKQSRNCAPSSLPTEECEGPFVRVEHLLGLARKMSHEHHPGCG
jgi:hypothetical protein